METTPHPGTLLEPGSPPARRGNPWIAASVVAHAGLLAFLLIHRVPRIKSVDAPGSASGHRLLLTYTLAGGAPAAALQTARTVKAQPVSKQPSLPSPVAAAPSSATTTVASTDGGAGSDALGDGELTLALVRLHPPPRPDLGQLPAGTRGDVVVDVVIDSSGRIAKSTMVKGLGHGVDEAVLATIQQWTFVPALRKGVPVASEQELLFHYERG